MVQRIEEALVAIMVRTVDMAAAAAIWRFKYALSVTGQRIAGAEHAASRH